MEIITFGVKQSGVAYVWRPGVYGLLFNRKKDRLAMIQTEDGQYFLPGGGIENNETHEECLKREAMEEIGMKVHLNQYIGCARNYSYSIKNHTYYLHEGYFYLGSIEKSLNKVTEEGYSLKWLEPPQAIMSLFHEHQSWAVSQLLKIRNV